MNLFARFIAVQMVTELSSFLNAAIQNMLNDCSTNCLFLKLVYLAQSFMVRSPTGVLWKISNNSPSNDLPDVAYADLTKSAEIIESLDFNSISSKMVTIHSRKLPRPQGNFISWSKANFFRFLEISASASLPS